MVAVEKKGRILAVVKHAIKESQLHDEFKIACIRKGINMNDGAVEAIKLWLRHIQSREGKS